MPKYTPQGIVYSIVVAKVALDDLAAIRLYDVDAADVILALLQEAKTNQSMLETFTIKDFGSYESKPYSVDTWNTQQRVGRNLWRIKVWELENHKIKHRVIYAFDQRISRYFVLGVFDRDFNYEESDERTKRILRSYESTGIGGRN